MTASLPATLAEHMIEEGRMACNSIDAQSPPSPTKDPRGSADHLPRRWLLGTILPSYGRAPKRPQDNAPTSVYRYYDSLGILLYIGITRTGVVRNVQHNRAAEWWPLVARQEVEHLPSRVAASLREKSLIQQYRPPFNVQHNPDHDVVRAAYLDLATAADPMERLRDTLRRLNRTLPVTGFSIGTDRYLRTNPEHFVIARMLELPASGLVSSTRGVRATNVETVGPCALIQIIGRYATHAASGAITVRMTSQKPERITLKSVSLVFDAPKRGREFGFPAKRTRRPS